jgi:hypothetical protein
MLQIGWTGGGCRGGSGGGGGVVNPLADHRNRLDVHPHSPGSKNSSSLAVLGDVTSCSGDYLNRPQVASFMAFTGGLIASRYGHVRQECSHWRAIKGIRKEETTLDCEQTASRPLFIKAMSEAESLNVGAKVMVPLPERVGASERIMLTSQGLTKGWSSICSFEKGIRGQSDDIFRVNQKPVHVPYAGADCAKSGDSLTISTGTSTPLT